MLGSLSFPCQYTESTTERENILFTHYVQYFPIKTNKQTTLLFFTSMVCVFPEDVCPYANKVPLKPSRTSAHIEGITTILVVLNFKCKEFPGGGGKRGGWKVDTFTHFTSHNLLSHGIVELLLSGAGLEYTVEVVRFPLRERRDADDQQVTHIIHDVRHQSMSGTYHRDRRLWLRVFWEVGEFWCCIRWIEHTTFTYNVCLQYHCGCSAHLYRDTRLQWPQREMTLTRW